MKPIVVLLAGICYFLIPSEQTKQKFSDPRDGNTYEYVELNGLNWFTENLRFKTEKSLCVSDSIEEACDSCGEFYPVKEALRLCPESWRLPTQTEVKSLIKAQRKRKININDTLNIILCGRIDNAKVAKQGEQNTYWLSAPLEDGFITHWHIFGQKHELHSHNVINAQRQFPVRCVCEIQ